MYVVALTPTTQAIIFAEIGEGGAVSLAPGEGRQVSPEGLWHKPGSNRHPSHTVPPWPPRRPLLHERFFCKCLLAPRLNEGMRPPVGQEDGGGGRSVLHDLHSAARSPAVLSIVWQTWNPDQVLDLCFGMLYQCFSAGLDESLICSSTIISMYVHNLGRVCVIFKHAFSLLSAQL